MARSEIAREPDRASDVDPGRAAEQQPLLDHEIEDDRQRLFVRNLAREVDRPALEAGGHPALSDALVDAGAGTFEFARRVVRVERRPHWIGESDENARVALFQRHADARQRAAGADRADE